MGGRQALKQLLGAQRSGARLPEQKGKRLLPLPGACSDRRLADCHRQCCFSLTLRWLSRSPGLQFQGKKGSGRCCHPGHRPVPPPPCAELRAMETELEGEADVPAAAPPPDIPTKIVQASILKYSGFGRGRGLCLVPKLCGPSSRACLYHHWGHALLSPNCGAPGLLCTLVCCQPCRSQTSRSFGIHRLHMEAPCAAARACLYNLPARTHSEGGACQGRGARSAHCEALSETLPANIQSSPLAATRPYVAGRTAPAAGRPGALVRLQRALRRQEHAQHAGACGAAALPAGAWVHRGKPAVASFLALPILRAVLALPE